MVTAVFQCSSPFVGYTIRVADRQKKEMTECSARQMTELGWQIFQVSGTYAILMDHEGRRYFHARQSESRAFDEQGRRIYTNVAFVGAPDNEQDCRTVTNIALYELFAPENFYQSIAGLICLTDEGFEVDFEKLECFLARMERELLYRTKSRQAQELWEEILRSSSGEKIRFVVLEATWEYFVKQVGTDFGRSVKRILSLQEVRKYAGQTEVVFTEREEKPGIEKSGDEDSETETVENAALKKKLSEASRELELLREEAEEQKRELEELKGRLISAKTETDLLKAALLRSKLFIIASAAAGAALAAVACLVFFR